MTHRSYCLIALAFVSLASVADASNNDRTRLSPACETALALSALPARLRAGSSVYQLTDGEFRLTVNGDGPFTCIVARNHRASLIPQCVDEAGADTIMPGIIRKSSWALGGATPSEAKERFTRMAEKGELRPPARAGINYMMSAYNMIWNAGRKSMMHIGPHVMYYAPGLTNEDVGGSMRVAMQENRGTPMVTDPGIHGYMTSFVEHASDSTDVIGACAAELPELIATKETRSEQ